MEFVIGIILLIIVLVIVMLIIRKRLYGSVDYYEEWKLKVMNRNIASELSRLKSLNLKGYTKGKFEHWKEKWDDILSNDLADVEELLYDAEHAVDQFRFSRARKILTQIDQTLEKLEQEIDLILQELEELLETERSTRAEEEKILPLIAELRNQLSQNRYKFERAENRL